MKDYSDFEASFSKKSVHDLFQAYLTFGLGLGDCF